MARPKIAAIEANLPDMTEYLLKNGAAINALGYHKNTGLHIAAKNDNLRIVKLLIQYNFEVDAKIRKTRK